MAGTDQEYIYHHINLSSVMEGAAQVQIDDVNVTKNHESLPTIKSLMLHLSDETYDKCKVAT